MKGIWGGTVDPDASQPAPVSVENLLRELDGDRAESAQSDARPQNLLADALASLELDEDFAFEESIVKHSLDELLLVLVGLHSDGTHGKQLMDDLSRLFDARLSPGTVYPRLHDLEEDDTVTVHEMVRTKEYTVADAEGAAERVRDAMNQHLAVGLFLQRALEDGALS